MSTPPVKKAAIKFAGSVAVLKYLKAERPLLWAAFLALNPLIRGFLESAAGENSGTSKLSNAATSVLLYKASLNSVVPKDYVSLIIWWSYFMSWGQKKVEKLRGKKLDELKEKTAVEVDSSESCGLVKCAIKKYDSLNISSGTFSKVAFSAIFAQLISHYLSHPSHDSNKYLADFITTRIFNPVWLNYSVIVHRHHLQWRGVLKNYIRTNLVFLGIFGAFSYSSVKEKINAKKHGIQLDTAPRPSIKEIYRSWVKNAFAGANSVVNLIYFPNLIAIVLFYLTTSPARIGAKDKYFRNYAKLVGFVSALIATHINFFPVNEKILNGINAYLVRLMILSRWRIAKDFKLSFPHWNSVETALMSFGVFTFMNARDNGADEGLAKLIGRVVM